MSETLREILVLGYHQAIRANRAEAEGLLIRAQALLDANRVLVEQAHRVIVAPPEDLEYPLPDTVPDTEPDIVF